MSVRRDSDLPRSIDAYLHDLDGALRGPRAWKRRVLAETADGMHEELDGSDDPAESEVVRRWGSIDDVAGAFNLTGRALRARRLAWNILQGTPILVIGWGLVVQLSPDPWPGEPPLVWWVAPLLFASTAAAVIGAVQVARGSARSSRVSDSASGTELRRGVFCACVGVGVGVACLAVLLCYRLWSSHWQIFWVGAITSTVLTVLLSAVVAVNAWHLIRSGTGRRQIGVG